MKLPLHQNASYSNEMCFYRKGERRKGDIVTLTGACTHTIYLSIADVFMDLMNILGDVTHFKFRLKLRSWWMAAIYTDIFLWNLFYISKFILERKASFLFDFILYQTLNILTENILKSFWSPKFFFLRLCRRKHIKEYFR